MKLITFLKEERNARKIFGKREIEIISKQMNGIRLTQSEKNRISRDIKPKLDFIEKLSEFKDEFPLKKNQDNNKIIQKAVNLILKDELKENIQAILLFGSFADNTATPRSDIDICTVFKQEISVKEATLFRIRIAGQLPEKADIQAFNILPQKIKKSIAQNHKVLYAGRDYDNMEFTIQYIKDDDYFIRMKNIFGVEA